MSILIKNCLVVTQDKQRRILKNHDILIEKGKIVKVARNIQDYADKIIDGENKVAIPGLINTHTHVSMTLFRGYADDMELHRWLTEKIWPLEAKLEAEDCYLGALIGCIEMVKSGITSFVDMYFFMNDVARAVKETGIRGFLSYAVLDFPTPCFSSPSEGIRKAEEFYLKWSGDPLVEPLFSAHAIYTCSEETLLGIKEKADKFKALIHIHLSETEKEVRESIEKTGLPPALYLEKIGFLSENVLAAHCTWLNKEEIGVFSEKKVKVSHNPVSNMKLAVGGRFPLKALMEKKVTLSLGTDGPASNNSLDLFETMKATSLLHKYLNRDPTFPSAQQVLDMATIGGATALRKERELGSIEPGKKADIVILNFRKPHLTPLHKVVSHLVYSAKASDVETVIINGEILLEEGKLLRLNERKVIERVNERVANLIKR